MNFTIGFDKKDLPKLHEMWNRIIETQKWSEGEFTEEFERKWGNYCGLKSVAFSSWSGAALSALEFFNLKGKTVLCPGNTFAATALVIKKIGANVEFVDCGRDDLCMDLEDLKTKIERFNPAAVFLVHIGGHIAFRVNEIAQLCKEKGIILLEDCAHAHGASWNGRKAGSWGDAGIYSFYATKTISTGEGGMLVSNNNDLIEFAKKYRNYGKPDYSVEGLNYRINEFAAAIGCVQTDRLDEIIAWKNDYAKRALDLKYPNRVRFPEGMTSGYYKYIVFNPIENSTGKVYDTPVYQLMKSVEQLPNCDWIAKNHWCVPIYYKGKENNSNNNMKFQRILVTGGSGFIGSHLVDRLIERGIRVRIYDLAHPDFLENYPEEKKRLVEYHHGDILDTDSLRVACNGIDAIYHLAAVPDVNEVAEDPAFAQKTNVSGTGNVLEVARIKKIKRVIFASTIWVYQNTPNAEGLLSEDASISHPDHLYAATKLGGEAQCIAYSKLYNVPITILRFGIAYGVRARRAVVSAVFVDKALKGEPITIDGDGSQYRKFVNVEDLAEGCALALSNIAENKIYNLEGDEKTTIKQIAETIDGIIGGLKVEYRQGRKSDFDGKNISNKKAKEELGWLPQINFKEGMEKYIKWYRENNV